MNSSKLEARCLGRIYDARRIALLRDVDRAFAACKFMAISGAGTGMPDDRLTSFHEWQFRGSVNLDTYHSRSVRFISCRFASAKAGWKREARDFSTHATLLARREVFIVLDLIALRFEDHFTVF
jgi:hypothetical protein